MRFWWQKLSHQPYKAKSPGLWDDEYIDAGVVIASKENNNYNTNCIDANIFTDTDGKTTLFGVRSGKVFT